MIKHKLHLGYECGKNWVYRAVARGSHGCACWAVAPAAVAAVAVRSPSSSLRPPATRRRRWPACKAPCCSAQRVPFTSSTRGMARWHTTDGFSHMKYARALLCLVFWCWLTILWISQAVLAYFTISGYTCLFLPYMLCSIAFFYFLKS